MKPESTTLTSRSDCLDKLSAEERESYQRYMDSGKPPLAPSVEVQLYQLFLHGKTCDEIVRLNPNFSLGMVVRARIEHFWDSKRDAHISSLLEGIRANVQQTQLEAVQFACDLLAAVHRLQGDKLKKYLQSGNQEELQALGGNLSLKTYKEMVQLLLQLTGQDKDKEKRVTGEILHKVETTQPSVPTSNLGLTPKQAARILEALEDDDKK